VQQVQREKKECDVTQDFRQASPVRNESPVARLDPGRRMVLMSLYASSVAFLLAGIWLLVADQDWFGADLAPIIGGALVFTAISDVLVVALLKRLWSGNTSRS
jgi:hypothetical protein